MSLLQIPVRYLPGLLLIGLISLPECKGQPPKIDLAKVLEFPKGRSTPKETLETFCFAWDAMKLHIPPSLMVAESCIDFPPETSVADKSQMVIFLGEILEVLSPPFIGASATIQGNKATLYQAPGMLLEFEKTPEHEWRFNRSTIQQLTMTYQKVIDQNKVIQSQRGKLVSGQGDPTELFETFFESATARNWETAAQCLDLSEIPPDKRRTEGPRLAALLAGSIQRLGYVYYQDVPVEPNRPPYAWYAGMAGGIICSRVSEENSPDKWVFNQPTVRRIESVWETVKNRQVDIRWSILNKVLPNPEITLKEGTAPAQLPPEYSSPKKVMEGFLMAIDQAEHDDSYLEKCTSFLDLSNFPKEEANRVGSKYAEKLEIIIRKLKPGIQEMDDRWSAPTTTISDKGLKIRLTRRPDGRWGFSEDTVLRIPAMFESLTPQEKGQGELTSGRSSPRETFVTFLRAVNDGRLAEASRCLDLGDLPVSARGQMGPLLAVKLKAIIDRIGYVYFHEIPSETLGPKYLWHRGPIGRITLSRIADPPDAGWRFTDSTVASIDQSIEKMINMPVDENLDNKSFIRTLPSWWTAPGLRFRFLLPNWLRVNFGPLQTWQWVGLALFPFFLALVFVGLGKILDPLTWWLLGIKPVADRQEIHASIRSIRFLLVVLLFFFLLPCLDLPMDVGALVYTVDEFLITGVIILSGFGAVDLFLIWSAEKQEKKGIQGFQDLLYPFLARLTKIVLVIGSAIYIVSCFDEGQLMGRFLAGLGVVGLAVSLAAQDSLKNLFATMLLIGDRSFSVGDLIHIGSHEGTVESVGFRSTRLKTREDSILIIPNSNLAGSNIDNMGLRSFRRVHGNLILAADSHADSVLALREELQKWLESRDDLDRDRGEVLIQGFTDKGIEMRFTAYVKGKSSGANRFREEFTLNALATCEKLGMKLAD